METATQPSKASEVSLRNEKSIARTSEFIETLETNRIGFAPLILVAMACFGGIAAAFAVKESDASLMAVAISTTFVEVLVIAVAPMRAIALAAIVALLVDLSIFIL